MENFLFSLNVVLPLFLLIMLGLFLKRIGIITEAFLTVASQLSFKVFMSVLLFYNVYHSQLDLAQNVKLIGFVFLVIAILFALSMILTPLFCKNRKRIPVIIQSFFRSNFLLFGLPMSMNVYGQKGAGLASMVAAMAIPTFNFLAVFVLSYYGEVKTSVRSMIKKIITNPFILATVLGFVMIFLNIQLPSALDRTLSDISKIATPFALICLGAEFEITSLRANMKALLAMAGVKLVLYPTIMIACALLAGFRGMPLFVLLSLSATPIAVSSHIMAKQARADDALAAQAIVVTTFCSAFTVFLWILLLKNFGFI